MDLHSNTKLKLTINILLLTTLHFGYAQPNFWQPTNGPYGGVVFGLESYSGGLLLAATSIGAAYSTDSGVSWNSSLNLPDYYVTGAACIFTPSILFIGSHQGLYRSTDYGNTWSKDSSRLGSAMVYSIASKADGSIFVGTADAIYRSSNGGETWADVSNGLNGYSVYCFLFDNSDNTILAGTGRGIIRSLNNGISWSRLDSLTITNAVFSLAKSPSSTFFAGATYQLFRSTDRGNNWTLDTSGLQSTTIDCIASDSAGIVFAGTGRGIFRSTDNGVHWNNLATNLPSYAYEVFTLVIDSTNALLIGTNEGIYHSTDLGQTWSPRMTGLRTPSIGNVCALSNGAIFATNNPGGAFLSTDFGTTWARLQSRDLNNFSVFRTFISNQQGFLFAGTSGHVYRSTNSGVDWDTLGNGLPSFTDIKRFALDSLGSIYAAGNYGVYKSTNNGNDWSNLISVFTANMDISNSGLLLISTCTLGFENDYVYNVYRSSDHGITWTSINNGLGLTVNGPSVGPLAVSPDGECYIVISSSTSPTSLFRSRDFGNNWVRLNFDSTVNVSQIVVNSEGKVFLGGNGVYRSTDNGNNWTTVVTGLRQTTVSSLSISNSGYLLAGTNDGVYRSVQATTSVLSSISDLPLSNSLSQNYPNPFNPSTTISFALPSRSFVTLRIFDVLGREVSTIVSGELEAGHYTRQWNAANITSGVYFCRLQSGTYSETKRLMLLK